MSESAELEGMLPDRLGESAPRAQTCGLTIVVPTFNESANIDRLLKGLDQSLKQCNWVVVFVDDDSPDGTVQVIRDTAPFDRRVRCIQRIGRRDLASACIEGMLPRPRQCLF